MYQISNEALALFHDRETHHVQMAEITCETVNDTIVITDEDIRSGGLSINRYCSVGGSIGIGSAVAAELTLSLDNSDGKFNGVIFEGADMHVVIKIRDVTVEDSPIYSIPMGYFTVDEAPRMLETINLVALDRMVLLDKAVDKDLLVFPSSLENLLHQVCSICNLSTDVSFSSQPNGSYMVTVAPESDDLTYRQIVSWIAELTGRCAYINHDGRLQFEFYDTGQLQPVTEIGLADRFSSDLAENAITISGVQIVSDEENKYLAGDEKYAFSIEGNELIRNGEQSVADALFAKLGGFTYTPFSAVIHSSPHLYPTDPVIFIDKDGNEHFSLITEVTFALNRNTSIESVGESALRKGWAATNPLTKRESLIIRSAFAEQNKRLDDRTQAIIAMNELISNAAGLYNTSIEQEDGSFLHYMHDRPYLEDSLTIYTQTASGYAWTNNGWNDGAPVWQYGFDKLGNMIMNAINAYRINADLVIAGLLKAVNGEAWFDLDKPEIVMEGEQADLSITPENPLKLTDKLGKFIGGLGVADGTLGLVSGVLTNDPNMNAYATIGYSAEGGVGISIYEKNHPDVYMGRLGSTFGILRDNQLRLELGYHTVLRDRNGVVRLLIATDDTYITDKNGAIRLWAQQDGDTYLCNPANSHAIGVDNSGPYFTKSGAKSYLDGEEEYTLTLQNGWLGTLTYRKNGLGQVQIKGNLTSPSSVAIRQLITTLPSGYRPSRTIAFNAYNTSTGRILLMGTIGSNGNIALELSIATGGQEVVANGGYHINLIYDTR